MRRLLFLLAALRSVLILLALFGLAAACAPAAVTVTVSPSSAALYSAQTQQFTAKLAGTTIAYTITWTCTAGTITASGLYTAPVVASKTVATVTATQTGHKWHYGTAAVTVLPQPAIGVTVSPHSVSILTGATQQSTATVTGTTNTAVTWSASGGTVSTSGLYTAPATAGTYTITATSQADNTKVDSAAATVTTPPNHTVDLTWSDSDPSVIGYNVYRDTVSGGPYTKSNLGGLVAAMLYTDSTVANATTYYYVTTAVDNSNAESGYSHEAQAIVP
jgi:hypothetical protein